MAKASWQYNAIMLIRILTDNPGPTFTRNMDKKFADTVKDLFRSTRDPSVRQMIMETLDTFEMTKFDDHGLGELIAMWKREKEKSFKQHGVRLTTFKSYICPLADTHAATQAAAACSA